MSGVRIAYGFPASADWVGRRLDFRFRAGGSGMLRSYYELIIKMTISGVRPATGLRKGFRLQPAGSAGGWISDFGLAALGCSVPIMSL